METRHLTKQEIKYLKWAYKQMAKWKYPKETKRQFTHKEMVIILSNIL